MTLRETIIADLKSIEADLGNQTFRWSSVDYVCIPASISTVDQLDDGGFRENVGVIIKARQELFGGVFPEAQDTITFSGSTYRIFKVTKDVFNAVIVLTCESPNKGK